MFLWFMQPDIWLTLITLTFLEIILGVDNIIFLSLVVAKQRRTGAGVQRDECGRRSRTSRVAL